MAFKSTTQKAPIPKISHLYHLFEQFRYFLLLIFRTIALNYTFLHSITLFCTDLELIEMFLTNQNAEIVACISLIPECVPLQGITQTKFKSFKYK